MIMSTLSIPLNNDLLAFVDRMVKSGKAENKAMVVRQALKLLAEEEAVGAVLLAEQELAEGKILRGNPRDLMKKLD